MSPEITQWLIYLGLALGGYLLRHWGIKLPMLPGGAPVPTPAPPVQPTPTVPASVLDNPRALELLRELLHAVPPSPKPPAT